jgi:hypothetical protein
MYNKATDALTITGDLTVRTTGLIVNTTGVGVNITPSVRLHLSDSDNPANGTLRLGSAGIYGQIKNSASMTGKLEFTSVGTAPNGGYNFSIEAQNAHKIEAGGVFSWFDGAGGTRMTLNANGLGVGVAPANNKLQVLGNIGLPNVCMASGETNGEFSIDVANLFAQTGAVWRQCSLLLVYSGVDVNLGNSTVLQTIITLQGLATWNTISKNDVVGVASVAVSLGTTTSARITVTVPAGNFGSAYVMLLGGVGPTTRPSVTINI